MSTPASDDAIGICPLTVFSGQIDFAVKKLLLAESVSSTDDRIPEHHSQYQVENPELRIREIINALDVLEHNPRIGRPVSASKQG